MEYINKNSQRKREIIEGGVEDEDLRIQRFRVKAGDYAFKDLVSTLVYEAHHNLLEDNGVKRGYTEEKRNGTYQRPAHLTDEFLAKERINYMVEYMKKYLDRHGPTIFKDFPGSRDILIGGLKGERMKLRKYPDLIKALYLDEED